MPLKTRLFSSEQPSYFNVAAFFAVLAYPHNEDKELDFRNQLRVACLKHAAQRVRGQAVIEVPMDVLKTELDPKFLSESLQILHRRFGLGFIVQRQVGLWDSKDYSRQTGSLLGAFIDDLGWKNREDASIPTAFTKEWKPAWPVLHAAAAFSSSGIVRKYGIPSLGTADIKFSDFDREYFGQLVFAFMMEERMEEDLVEYAQEVRTRILEQKLYKKIRESDMVEFSLDRSAFFGRERPWWKGSWQVTNRIKLR